MPVFRRPLLIKYSNFRLFLKIPLRAQRPLTAAASCIRGIAADAAVSVIQGRRDAFVGQFVMAEANGESALAVALRLRAECHNAFIAAVGK